MTKIQYKVDPGAAGRNARATGSIKFKTTVMADRPGRQFRRADVRVRDIEKLIECRYGSAIPDVDDEQYSFVVGNAFLAGYGQLDGAQHFSRWLNKFTPWRRNCQQFASEMMAKIRVTALFADASAGRNLKLLISERDILAITTLSPFDLTAEAFKAHCLARKRERDRLKAAERRAAEGGLSRPEWKRLKSEESTENKQPWIAQGISRRTFYNRKKAIKPPSEAIQIAPFERNCTQSVARVEKEIALSPSHAMTLRHGRDGLSASALLFEYAASLLSLKPDGENSSE